MDKLTQIDILKDLMRKLDARENVDAGVMYQNPTSVYTCPDLAAKEWRTFFKGHTQLIGLSSDLPKPGSFLTMDDFGVPILATRGKDERCRAFLNICRHRGVQVEHEENGTRSAFSCPFHQWTYNDMGDLIAIPDEHEFGKIDKSCHGLISLPMEERHGMLWLHPDPDGILDLDNMLEGLEGEFSSWKFQNLVSMGQTTIAKRLNWKLANDTFGETNHFQKLHKHTLGKVTYGECLNYETFRRNHRFVFPRRMIDELRDKPEEDWRLTDGATTLYFLFPNIQFIIGNGSTNIVRLYPHPTDPNESITKINHYFTKGAIAAAAEIEGHGENVSAETVYDLSQANTGIPSLNATKEVFNSTIEQEDYVMGATTQRSAETGLLDHIIFGRNEPALHHYHKTFRTALQMPPLEEVIN